MQFYLNGFKPGNPFIADAPETLTPHSNELPKQADVVIVGSGPAGLTLAAQLAQFPDIKTVLIEQKEGPLQLGQADGIACRTMEMFEAFNFSHRVLKEACWINEVTFWKPDDKQPENIVRHGRVHDTADDLSEFPHVVLNQARVHDFYLETMRNSPTRLEPHYSRKLLDVKRDDNQPDYPVTVTVERSDAAHAGQQETIRARYVVGCDGARSRVRQAIGLKLIGDSANQAWGVMDVLVDTTFPDIRYKVLVQSAHAGNMVMIPREGGYLVRFYVEMDELDQSERVADREISLDDVIKKAQTALHPYKLDIKEVPWWSVYEIGQRICERFDDVPADAPQNYLPRIFIAGDACHTHSPKAGQGMNFSMQDTFNLGWKLAAVLRGQYPPSLLNSYNTERRAVCQDLIDFDREWAAMISDDAKLGETSQQGGVDPAELQRYFEQSGRFTAGMATHYRPSLICGDDRYQALASKQIIGTRFHSAPVTRICDAKRIELGHCGKADGRWRLYAFAGKNDYTQQNQGLFALCQFLEHDEQSPIRRYTPKNTDIDAVFDVRAVFQEAHPDVALEKMPHLLLPNKGRYQQRDHDKLFSAYLRQGDTEIYERRGINREEGALIIVRPDQYIAHVLPLSAHQELAEFFAGFMLEATQP